MWPRKISNKEVKVKPSESMKYQTYTVYIFFNLKPHATAMIWLLLSHNVCIFAAKVVVIFTLSSKDFMWLLSGSWPVTRCSCSLVECQRQREDVHSSNGQQDVQNVVPAPSIWQGQPVGCMWECVWHTQLSGMDGIFTDMWKKSVCVFLLLVVLVGTCAGPCWVESD